MKGGFRRAILLLLAVAACPGSAAEITWMLGLPLLYTPDERQRTETFNDTQVAYLIGHLGAFEHKIVPGNQKRNIYTMEHGDGFCVHSLIRSPEREQSLRFSKRPLPYPGFRLVLRARHLPDLAPFRNPSGAIDLKRLVGIKGGYNASRPYPDAIRDFVGRAAMEPVQSTRQLFNLIREDRVLFGFASPIDVAVVRGIPGDPFRDLVTVPVADVPAIVNSYVACSNGPLGSQVIEAVDRLFDNQANWQDFIAPLQPLIPPEDFAAMR